MVQADLKKSFFKKGFKKTPLFVGKNGLWDNLEDSKWIQALCACFCLPTWQQQLLLTSVAPSSSGRAG